MLIIVRHGQTDANARGVLLGRADPPLSEVGRVQAEAVADAIGPLPTTTRVVASPLARTTATAAIVAAAGPSPVEIDERWIELDYGALEGTALSAVPAETWAQWRSDPDFVPAGGESLRALGRRVGEACAELLAEAAEHDIVVVTHVSPIKAAVVWALGVGDDTTWRLFVAPGSITRIKAGQQGPVVASFNETPWARPHP